MSDDPCAGENAGECDDELYEDGTVTVGELQSKNFNPAQLLRNVGMGYVSLATSVTTAAILTPLVLRRTGASTYGLWVTLTTAASYIGLLDAGVSSAASRDVAAHAAVGDYTFIGVLFSTLRRFFLGTAILAVIIGALSAFGITDLLRINHDQISAARLAVLILAANAGITFLTSIPTSLLYGMGRSDLVISINAVTNILLQIGQLVAVIFGAGLIGLVSVPFGISAIVCALLYRRSRPYRPSRGVRPDGRLLRNLMRDGSQQTVIGLGGSLAYGMDSLIVAGMLPIKAVAPYDLALSTAAATRSVATAGTNLLFPSYSHADAVNERDKGFDLFLLALWGSMTITVPVAVSLIVFGHDLLALWLKLVPSHTYAIVVVLAISNLLQLGSHQSFYFLMAAKRLRFLTVVSLPLAVSNVALSIVFTRLFGPIGPALGSLPQVAIVDFLWIPITTCRIFGQSSSRYLKGIIQPLVILVACTSGLAVILRLAFGSAEDWVVLPLAGLLMIGTWLGGFVWATRSNPLFGRYTRSYASRAPRWLRWVLGS